MAQDKAHISSSDLLPAYNYLVTVLQDGKEHVLSFAEISGLSQEYEAVTYKHGFSFVMGDKIIPGMRQPVRLTMKRGVAKERDFLQSWIDSAYGDPYSPTSAKRDILIDLRDASGNVVVRWQVQRALPVKLDAPGFDANTNEIAIETMELVAHGLQVKFQP
jgi:phage tail-like protein